MQPAVEADIRAMRESLERLIAEEQLPASGVAVLGEVRRSLRRLERTWARVLPYLLAENAATAALLAEVAPLVPADLQAEITTAGRALDPVPDTAQLDAVLANERNGVLRGLLARVIETLPADESGARARARARKHLQDCLELRPW